jgi:uncharacterized protein YnzC (UPF0291/DUF896 family)
MLRINQQAKLDYKQQLTEEEKGNKTSNHLRSTKSRTKLSISTNRV